MIHTSELPMPVASVTLCYDRFAGHEQRTRDLVANSFKGCLITADGNTYGIAIRNLLASGFTIESKQRLELGTTIRVKCSGVMFKDAYVRRRNGFDYGCEFSRTAC